MTDHCGSERLNDKRVALRVLKLEALKRTKHGVMRTF